MAAHEKERRLGFAVKVMGEGGIPSHDGRRWQSGPSLGVSLEAFGRVLDYLERHQIRMYRMTSDFVPYATHPDLPQFHEQLETFAEALQEVGERVRRQGVRLSLHPSQYIVLNAEDEAIARKSAVDLDVQARLLDALGQGAEGVVVLHVGGVYGNREAALARFVERYLRLSEPVRRRLVIENDETSYTIADCLWIHARTGVPVVFDHQHHRLNHGGWEAEAAARAALATWPAGVRPKMHFSSARLDGREVKRGREKKVEAPLLRQHADYIDPWTFAEFVGALADCPFDVMLEAKAKDLALRKLRSDLAALGLAGVLALP